MLDGLASDCTRLAIAESARAAIAGHAYALEALRWELCGDGPCGADRLRRLERRIAACTSPSEASLVGAYVAFFLDLNGGCIGAIPPRRARPVDPGPT